MTKKRIDAGLAEASAGKQIVHKQSLELLTASLATTATTLSADIPSYDPQQLLVATDASTSRTNIASGIYVAPVDGDVVIKTTQLPQGPAVAARISDRQALDFIREMGVLSADEDQMPALAYYEPAGSLPSFAETGANPGSIIQGPAENVTVMPKSIGTGEGGEQSERVLTVKAAAPLEDTLKKNGFNPAMVSAIIGALRNVYPSTMLSAGTRLRILLGPSKLPGTAIPYRLSIYTHDDKSGIDRHAASVALTDSGQYVLATEPPKIAFPPEDTEEVSVGALPSIYRSIWETGRQHDLPDAAIEKILAMYAYEVDLTKPVVPGDSIELLQTAPDSAGEQDLLYIALKLGSTTRERFRFQSDDVKTSYYGPEGETGKRFLTRRPLRGGGRVSSPFGWRTHPIFHTRLLHTGVDLAAPSGTPIYASGDGEVERAGQNGGYGNFILLKHSNGYETAYAHLSRYADTTKVGAFVRQGQVIGYVGQTGDATGPHLHFEIRINGHFVDPLSVKLPTDTPLPAQDRQQFDTMVAGIQTLLAQADK